MPAEMSPRERVLAALRRQRPDRIPKSFGLTAALVQKCRERIGTDDYDEHFGIEVRWAGGAATKEKHDFSAYYTDRPDITETSEWGVAYESANFYHFWNMVHPLRHASSPKERIETVGPEGLLIAPTHILEPEVPCENIIAFVEAVDEFGAVGG